ncbi:MAG: ABC transporter permease, partial [Hyphomicrobiaceae bacterium]
MAVIDHDAELRRAGAMVRGYGGALVHFMRRYPLGAIGALIMLLFIATALFADQITSYDPTSTNPRVSLARPGEQHMLGADFMGRDVFSRIVYGARISLAVAIGATALGCLIGVSVGLLSGFFGGWVDLIVQRLIDIMQALPLLVMALIMAASLGPSLGNTIV